MYAINIEMAKRVFVLWQKKQIINNVNLNTHKCVYLRYCHNNVNVISVAYNLRSYTLSVYTYSNIPTTYILTVDAIRSPYIVFRSSAQTNMKNKNAFLENGFLARDKCSQHRQKNANKSLDRLDTRLLYIYVNDQMDFVTIDKHKNWKLRLHFKQQTQTGIENTK